MECGSGVKDPRYLLDGLLNLDQVVVGEEVEPWEGVEKRIRNGMDMFVGLNSGYPCGLWAAVRRGGSAGLWPAWR